MTIELNSQEVRAIDTEARQLAERAQGYEIRTAEHYADAGARLTEIKGAQKRVEALRTSITKPLNAALKAANDFFREPATRLDNAERAIKRAMLAYDDEQRRIAAEAQRKLDEQARRERERLEAQAREAERKAAEKAAADRAAAEKAAAEGRTAEAARLAARADATEAKAADKVDALAERAATVSAPVVQAAPPKVAGLSGREVPKFEIVDEAAIPREYLMIDEQKIRRVVNALRTDAKIPGVKVWMEKQLAARSA